MKIENVLIEYAEKINELAEKKAEINKYISSYDVNLEYTPTNHLMDTYKALYRVRNEGHEEYCPNVLDYYDSMSSYDLTGWDDSNIVSKEEVSALHNMFIKKRKLKKELGYIKGKITKYAKKIYNQKHLLCSNK